MSSQMPEWRAEIRARLAAVRLSPEREVEIVDELAQHLEERWLEAIAAGATPDEAARAARAAFSEPHGLARQLAPLQQARWTDPSPPAAARRLSMAGLGADLRLAIRGLRAAPLFAAISLLVLALGIGATTAIFSVVDAVVLRGLPFEDDRQLLAIGERFIPRPGGPRRFGPVPVRPGAVDTAVDPQAVGRRRPQTWLDALAQQRVFESIAVIAENPDDTLTQPGAEPATVSRHRVTAGFFDVLRVRPALGRAFTVDNEVDGRDRVVILSEAFWRRRFGGDTRAIGTTIAINGTPHEILGVMPRGFAWPVGATRPADLWAPWVPGPNERVRGRGISIYLQGIGRLKPGVTPVQAQEQMDQVSAAIERANPVSAAGVRIGVRPLRDHLVGASTSSWLLMLLTAVGFVLLIACANVANLWLARASLRERDVAVRSALGASRWRLVRQQLVESVLASTLGATAGLLLAWPAIRLLRSAMPEEMARITTVGLDVRVLGLAAALALVTGLLSGLVPAVRASGLTLVDVLNPASRGGVGTQRRLRSVLVVVEVALAVVLLVGAALFVGSFVRVMRLDPGFQTDRVLTMQIVTRPSPGGGQGEPDLGPTFIDLATRLATIPGVVVSAAASPGVPLRLNMWTSALSLRERTIEGDPSVSVKVVTWPYLRALAIPLRQGRFFNADDRAGGAPAIVLSEAAARRFFDGENPVGRTVVFNNIDRTVVGVVANVRQWNLETTPHPEVYLPMTQMPTTSAWLVIRTEGEPYAVLPAVRAAVAAQFPDDPLRSIATMDELVAGQTAGRRLNMLVLSLLGVLGLVISTAGVFGVMAYLVAQRTREIGVRMALGATRVRVVSTVVAEAAALGAAGVAIGGVGGIL